MHIPVMALDPSLRNTGIALGYYDTDLHEVVVEDIRLVRTEADKSKQVRKNSDDLRCAREIRTALAEAHRQHKPAVVFAEVPSGTQSSRASWTLGVTVGLLAAVPLPLVEVTPKQVKRTFTGHGGASKQDIIDLAVKMFPDLPWLHHHGKLVNANEHMADAVAVMFTGVATDEFKGLVRVIEAVDTSGA